MERNGKKKNMERNGKKNHGTERNGNETDHGGTERGKKIMERNRKKKNHGTERNRKNKNFSVQKHLQCP